MTGADFLAAVGAAFDVPAEELATRSRRRHCTHPRFAAYWLARMLPCDGGRQRSLPEIGRLFDRDHASVSYGIDQAEALLAEAGFVERLARAGAILAGLSAGLIAAADDTRHPAVLTHRVKPKNEPAANDSDRMKRFRGSRGLIEAIRREHPERCQVAA